MITDWLNVNADALSGLLAALICFALGVAWSAYRAVGWVDRMRAWALSVDTEVPGIAGQSLDPKGWN